MTRRTGGKAGVPTQRAKRHALLACARAGASHARCGCDAHAGCGCDAHLAQQRCRRGIGRGSPHVLRGPAGAAQAHAQRRVRLVAVAVARRRAHALKRHFRQQRLGRLHRSCNGSHVAQRRRLPQRGRAAVAHLGKAASEALEGRVDCRRYDCVRRGSPRERALSLGVVRGRRWRRYEHAAEPSTLRRRPRELGRRGAQAACAPPPVRIVSGGRPRASAPRNA